MSLLISEKQSITLKFDPAEVDKQFAINIDSKFEPYTGANMKLTVGDIRRRGGGEKIHVNNMAKELAAQVGYTENYIRISPCISLASCWEDSNDGFIGHDILNTYVRSIEVTLVLKNKGEV